MNAERPCQVCSGTDLEVVHRAPAGPVARCRRCGFGVVVGDLDVLSAGYRAADRSALGRGGDGRDAARREWVTAMLPTLVPPGPVVEFGPGIVAALSPLGEGREVTGSVVETDLAAAQGAGIRRPPTDPAGPVGVDEGAAGASAVLAFDVLEVQPDIRAALVAATGLLAPEGILVAELPVLPPFDGAAGTDGRATLAPDVLWYPTQAAVQRLLEADLGLVVAVSSHDDPPGVPRCLLLASRSPALGPRMRDLVERVLFGPVHWLQAREDRRLRALFEVVYLGRTRPEVVGLLADLTTDDHSNAVDRRLARLWSRDLGLAERRVGDLDRDVRSERIAADARLTEAWRAADRAAHQARLAAEELGAQRLLAEARLQDARIEAEAAADRERDLVDRLIAAERRAALSVPEDTGPGPVPGATSADGVPGPSSDETVATVPGSVDGQVGRWVRGALFAGRLLGTRSHRRDLSQGLRLLLDADARTIWRLRFDGAAYLQQNPDVAAAGLPASLHYLLRGHAEGREPSALFSARAYLEANPDVRRTGVNPLIHYALHGVEEGRTALTADAAVVHAAPRTDGSDPLRSDVRSGRPTAPWPASKPLVSLVALIEDEAADLASVIELAERQTWQDLQLIAVLPGPDAGSPGVHRLSRQAWRGSLVVRPEDHGLGAAGRLDLGLRHAAGRYVVGLRRGVRLHPTTLETALFLAEEAGVDVVEGAEHGRLRPRPLSLAAPVSMSGDGPVEWSLVRRSTLVEAGGYIDPLSSRTDRTDAPSTMLDRGRVTPRGGGVLVALPARPTWGWSGELLLRGVVESLRQAGTRVIVVHLGDPTATPERSLRGEQRVDPPSLVDESYDLSVSLPSPEHRQRFLHHLVERHAIESLLICGADALGDRLLDLRQRWPHLTVVEQAMDDDRVNRDRHRASAVDLIVAPSERIRRRLVEELHEPWHRIRTILPASVDPSGRPEAMAPRDQAGGETLPGSDPVVGMYCQWSLGMRPVDAASIARDVASAHPVTFAFFGDGPVDALMDPVLGRYALSDRLLRLEPHAEAKDFVDACDIVVLPGEARGAWMMALLAMRAGRVVVAAPAAGVQELIDDGRTGVLSTADDVGSIVAGIQRVVSDTALRRRIADDARPAVERDASGERSARQYLDAFAAAREIASARIEP